MPKTLAVTLSDAAIKRHIQDPSITQLRDPRYPVRVRFHACRERASWYVVRYAGGRGHWHRVGNYPELTTRALLARLPELEAKLALDPAGPVGVDAWETVADLLCWYRDRSASHGRLSATRKSSIKTAVNRHLLPLFGAQPLAGITPACIDSGLVWPLQEHYSVAYVRLIFGVIKAAFKQARKLNLLDTDPFAGVNVGDFIDAKTPAKAGALTAADVPDLISALRSCEPPGCFLLLLMLLFGTRISETRLAKWGQFDLEARTWTIPTDNTKSKRQHRLPLTAMAVTLLTRYRAYQQANGYRGVYLFPGASKGKPLSRSAVFDLVVSASGARWHSHDLRKLARTTWADLGVEYLAGELLLNHALSKLDRTYIHTYAERQILDALERWHTWLCERGFSVFLAETEPRLSFYHNSDQPQWWQGVAG